MCIIVICLFVTELVSLDDILQAILPEELCNESPTGFSITGHLGRLFIVTRDSAWPPHLCIPAHLNLNNEYLPYKHIIGQVILDVCILDLCIYRLPNLSFQKHKQLTTVVNKLDSIDTKFRFFKMELIAGEPDYIVEHVGLSPSISNNNRITSRGSMNLTVDLLSTLPKSIGTLDCIQNIGDLCNYFSQKMLLQTCLLG